MKKGHPWVRLFARLFDTTIPFTLLVLLLDTGSPVWREFQWLNVLWVWVIATIVWIPLEAGCVSLWGATPGKALLNIRLTKQPFPLALKRAAGVWWRGMGGGVLILSQVLWVGGYRYLTHNGTTPWDRASGSHVTHGPVGFLRGVSLAVIWIILDLIGYNLSGWFAQTFLFMQETSLQWPT